jgi:hypothetical protein
VQVESTKQSPKQKVPDAPEQSDDQVASTSDSMVRIKAISAFWMLLYINAQFTILY